MKTYILKLKTTSTTNYNLYDGTTLVSDSDLATLFGSAGSAYFTFDFNEGTPTNTTSLTILNSQDTAVMTNTGLEGIAEDRNFKGVWADSATAFTSFTLLKGVAMDEAELTALVGMVKNAGGIKTLTAADYNYPTDNPTRIATWKLPEGIYQRISSSVLIQYWSTDSDYQKSVNGNGLLIIGHNYYNNQVSLLRPGGQDCWQNIVTGSGGNLIKSTLYSVEDSLTSTSSNSSLSAKQGKVLNERIGDLTTLTTSAKTSTVAAINEIVTTIGNVESALNIINNGSES